MLGISQETGETNSTPTTLTQQQMVLANTASIPPRLPLELEQLQKSNPQKFYQNLKKVPWLLRSVHTNPYLVSTNLGLSLQQTDVRTFIQTSITSFFSLATGFTQARLQAKLVLSVLKIHYKECAAKTVSGAAARSSLRAK